MRILGLLVGALAVTLLVVAAGAATLAAATRISAAVPVLTPTVTATNPWVPAAGAAAPIVTPTVGSLAIDAVVEGVATHLAATDAATVRPIASVTKTMTALAILDAHPLKAGEAGPVVTITAEDVADYRSIAASGGSFAPVLLGERFSERDLLIGLMLPSANNLALTAARWVDGSVAAFVARLNSRAQALGMTRTHFADPAGLSAATTSTAADLVLLGEAAVANDALISVVSTTAATLPDGTPVKNLDILLGTEPGWLGIKTGWTPDAGGCLLFAARRAAAAGTAPLVVVGAVLGQLPDGNVSLDHPELGGAFLLAQTSVQQAYAGHAAVRVGPASIPISGQVFGPWGTASGVQLSGPAHTILLARGDALAITSTPGSVRAPLPAGSAVGSVRVSLNGLDVGHWSLLTTRQLVAPSPWWRLLNG